MKNFVQDGTRMRYTAGGSISSGDVIVAGSRIGIAPVDAVSGDTIELSMEGVFTLTKKSGDTFSQGDLVYWDASPGECTTTTSGNTLAGYAFEDAGSSVTTMKVKINA